MPDEITDSSLIWVQFRSGGPWHAARRDWRFPKSMFATQCKRRWSYQIDTVKVSTEPGPAFCGQPACARAGNAYRRDRDEARRAAAADNA